MSVSKRKVSLMNRAITKADVVRKLDDAIVDFLSIPGATIDINGSLIEFNVKGEVALGLKPSDDYKLCKKVHAKELVEMLSRKKVKANKAEEALDETLGKLKELFTRTLYQ